MVILLLILSPIYHLFSDPLYLRLNSINIGDNKQITLMILQVG